MQPITLNEVQTASLLLLSTAISNILTDGINDDIIEELKTLEVDLENILFKENALYIDKSSQAV